jgi:hypothetical protein
MPPEALDGALGLALGYLLTGALLAVRGGARSPRDAAKVAARWPLIVGRRLERLSGRDGSVYGLKIVALFAAVCVAGRLAFGAAFAFLPFRPAAFLLALIWLSVLLAAAA